ncbi:MAG: hypothetical protein RIB84_23810 [Sneathiellaceae bacterium]
MIAFREPTAGAVEIWAVDAAGAGSRGERFLAALRATPEVQRLKIWAEAPPAPICDSDIENYVAGFIRGAAAAGGDLVVGLALGPLRDPHSGPGAPARGRPEASPGVTRTAMHEAGRDPGGVSSLDSAAGGDAAGRLFSEETPYARIRTRYGLTFRPGDRVRYVPFDAAGRDFTGTVQAPCLPDGGDFIAVVADGCGSPMACHPIDLALLDGQDGQR